MGFFVVKRKNKKGEKIMTKALVLFSGGQDSTTCLFWAKQKFDEIIALNIYYHQKHKIEVESAEKITSMFNISLIKIETDVLQQIGNSALLEKEGDVTCSHPNNPNLPASFVPGRNLLFLTIAAAIAYRERIQDIITGVCETDYSGYPDCRADTITSLEMSLSLGMEYPFSIHTPLMKLNKSQTVLLAKELPGCLKALQYSHTCYNGVFPPCRTCPACIIRKAGFNEAGIIDPLILRKI